jgi:hypothetical protein
LKRVSIHAPRYKDLLQRKLQEELDILLGVGPDRFQKHQGRALVLRELLDELKAVSG